MFVESTSKVLFVMVVSVAALLVQNSLGGVISRDGADSGGTLTTIEPPKDLSRDPAGLPEDHSTDLSTDPTTEISTDLPTYLLPPPIDGDIADRWSSGVSGAGKEENEYGFFDRIIELLFVMHDFYALSDSTLTSGMQLFEEVINDVSTATSIDQKEEIGTKTAELREFIDKVKQNDPVRSFQFHEEPDMALLQSFMDILDKFNASALDEANAVDLLFDSALRKHGLVAMEKEIGENFSAYLTKYKTQLEKFEESVVEAEPKTAEDEQLKEWLMEMKELLKNIETIVKFFNEQTKNIESGKEEI